MFETNDAPDEREDNTTNPSQSSTRRDRRAFLKSGAVARDSENLLRSTPTTDSRALEAYASWLFMERRILCGELWPHMGALAEKFDFADNAGYGWHFRGDLDWRDHPQPSTRAAAVLGLVGVDWRRQPQRVLEVGEVDNGHRPELPANWPEVDGELVAAYEEIVSLDVEIDGYCTTVSDDERYEHKGYRDAEAARYDAIDRLGEIPAQSWRGAAAKAAALKMVQIQDDYERTRIIAESLADDVLQLAAFQIESVA